MTNLASQWDMSPKARGHEFHRFGEGLIAHYNHINILPPNVQKERIGFSKIYLLMHFNSGA